MPRSQRVIVTERERSGYQTSENGGTRSVPFSFEDSSRGKNQGENFAWTSVLDLYFNV